MSGFVHEAAVGNSVEWYTPKSVFDALGVGFDLDVCSPGLDKKIGRASCRERV